MSQRFLLSRLSALGDVVCSLPVAACLKEAFPGCHIVWVVDPRFAGIVECCGSVDEIIRAKPGLDPKTWPKVGGSFDAALDLQGLFKSGIVVGRASAKVKLGYHWQRECAWLFSRRVLPDPTSSHVVDQYLDVARAVGCEVGQTEFRTPLGGGNRGTANDSAGGTSSGSSGSPSSAGASGGASAPRTVEESDIYKVDGTSLMFGKGSKITATPSETDRPTVLNASWAFTKQGGGA